MVKTKQDPHRGLRITSVVNKAILALIRDGDYQHPGEAEAIEKIFEPITKNSDRLILDVGCGRGGTADYIFKHGWGKVIGIDINAEIVDTANKNFGRFPLPDQINIDDLKETPVFSDCDATDAGEFLSDKFKQQLKFDVICFVSSFFLIAEQEKTLTELRKFVSKDGRLIIFDYIDHGEYRKHDYKENSKTLMTNLLTQQNLEELLHNAGWKIDNIVNLDKENIRWYQDLADRTENRKEDIISAHGEEAFECFKTRYTHLLDSFSDGYLGGTLIYARTKG